MAQHKRAFRERQLQRPPNERKEERLRRVRHSNNLHADSPNIFMQMGETNVSLSFTHALSLSRSLSLSLSLSLCHTDSLSLSRNSTLQTTWLQQTVRAAGTTTRTTRTTRTGATATPTTTQQQQTTKLQQEQTAGWRGEDRRNLERTRWRAGRDDSRR